MYVAKRKQLRALLAAIVLTVGAAACTRSDEKSEVASDSTPAMTPAPTAPDSGGMASMNGMSGNPDQDFLRMMSDHHKGMTLMAHETLERSEQLAVKTDAKKMDAEQDAELSTMAGILKKDFSDDYQPKVTAENQAMVDAMKPLTGAAYDKAFRENTIQHHRMAIKMVDEFMPQLTRADLKAMAEKMKSTQTKEIAEQERKLEQK